MRWDVEVFGGVEPSTDVAAITPVKFSPPTVYVDGDETSEPMSRLIYSGVLLETRSPGSISMYGPAFPNGTVPSIRVMENVWHVYFSPGGLEVEGVELRPDGVAVHSRWECQPAPPSEEDLDLLRAVFGDDGEGSA